MGGFASTLGSPGGGADTSSYDPAQYLGGGQSQGDAQAGQPPQGQGNGSSPGEAQLESQIRNFTRLVNRNQEAPFAEMLQHNKTELAKLAPHVHVTEIQ